MTNLKNVIVNTVAAAGLAAVVSGCAALSLKPDFYPNAGDAHTITYKDNKGVEKTVFDLSGKWATEYYGRDEIVKIIQTEDGFEGYKTIGSTYVGAGSLTIRGGVVGNMVQCETLGSSGLREYLISKLSKNIDEFKCQGDGVRILKKIE